MLGGEMGHNAISSGQSERASSGKADGIDAVDEIPRRKGVGLACTGSTAPNVHTGCGPLGGEYDGSSASPASTATLMVSDPDTGDIGDRP